MSAGQLLQKLYSYNESTGADVGGIKMDLMDSDEDVADLIELINENNQLFQSPKEGSDDHFTDIVGGARIAADEGRNEDALDLLNNTLIDVISETVDTFEEIEEEIKSLEGVNDILHQTEYVRNAYEYMLEMAETAEEKLSSAQE